MNNKVTILLVLKCIALAMGVAVIVICLIGEYEIKNILSMLGIAVVCLALGGMLKENKETK